MITITVEVQGGLVHKVSGIPEGVEVVVRDYDIMEIEGRDVKRDKTGPHVDSTWITGDKMDFGNGNS